MPKQSVLRQRRQGTHHAAKGHVTTGLELRRRTAGKQTQRGGDPIEHARAGHAQTVGRGEVLDGPLGLVGDG